MARDPKKPLDPANDDHEVVPEAAAEPADAIETSRSGNAALGAMLDAGRSKAKQGETERELRETTDTED